MNKNNSEDKLFKRILEVKEYIQDTQNVKLPIETIMDFLEYAINMDDFQIWVLGKKYIDNQEFNQKELLEEFLNQVSNNGILILYDLFQNEKQKNIENIGKRYQKTL